MKGPDIRLIAIILGAILLCIITEAAPGVTLGSQGADKSSKAAASTFQPSSYKLFSKFAVATDTKVCSRIGRDIIRKNGSVVDSAIASMLCVGVINSHSNGIGGGHVAIIYAKPKNGNEKELTTLISRERAPYGSSESMFAHKSSLFGGLAVAVPGEIKGFYEAWKKFGWLPWKDLVEPTIRLLEDGYEIEKDCSNAITRTKHYLLNDSLVKSQLLRETFIPNGSPLQTGDKLKDPRLAETFKIIANKPEDFYTGKLAKLIVKELREEGGIISESDLANYKPEWKQPVEILLNGNKSRLYSLRPPASGAVLALILNILKHYNFSPSSVDTNSKVLTFHRIMEAFRFAYAGRLELGDENFVNVSDLVSNMTSEEFAIKLWKKINDSSTQPVDKYRAMYAPWTDHGTAHLSILHPDGSAVAMTSTINTEFGSLIKGRKTGIIYNNEMDDFSMPNRSNYYGYAPSPNNYIAPRKRPMSSMCPSLMLDDQGKVRMVVGASGGSRITTSTAWILLNSYFFNLTLGKATDFPRQHNQLLPDWISYESGSEQALLDGLVKKGHNITIDNLAGVSQTIRNWCRKHLDKNCIEAVSDGRKFGEPSGF